LLLKEIKFILNIYKLYEQQEYTDKNNTHSAENRIVSIHQPYLRPIVREKAKVPVEFGAKLDLSIVDSGLARIEKISFEAYNESTCLIEAIERYLSHNGYYPERVLADKIYRIRDNINYCKFKGIRLSGPTLGCPSKNAIIDKKVEYQDNVDRIEVEQVFSLTKHSCGLGLVRTKLENTTLTAITLSIFTMNLFKVSLHYFLKLNKMFRKCI
jgi:hypothetical protein